jgi:dihydrofolate reductase
MISIIAAVSENRAIGKDNKLLYWLPNDLKRFKALTTGHTIIMGRKTFDSLPKGALPNRRNVVISRSVKELPGCEVYPSLLDAISTVQTKRSEQGDSEIYIIGGESVYTQAMPFADRLCLTIIHDVAKEADAFFPPFDDWKEIAREDHTTDEKHSYNYSFVDYKKE